MARVQKIDDSIGKRLRSVRRSVGDTAEDLAKWAGVTRSYIGQIEHSRIKNPDQNGVIKRISERWAHLGISYEWLLTGQGEPPNLPRPHKHGDLPSYWRPIIPEWHADEITKWEWILPDHALPSTQATTIAFKVPADLGTAIKRGDFVFVDRTQKKISEPRGLWLVRLENKKPPTLVQIHLTPR